MQNSLHTLTDQERLRNLARKMGVAQTDITRLWQRMPQTPDGVGDRLTGAYPISTSYTPAQAPTTTAAPTTSTTTTPTPDVQYIYPTWDRLRSPDIVLSSGSQLWAVIGDDYGNDWPDDTNYFSIQDGQQGDFTVLMQPLFPFRWLSGIEFQAYVKNTLPSAPLVFDVSVWNEDFTILLAGADAVSSVGVSESSYILRTKSLSLTPEAHEETNWGRPILAVDIQTDTEAGTPELFVSSVRLKATLVPLILP